jgi:acetyl esterase
LVTRLPDRLVRRLAGPPIRIDGQELNPQAQLLLRLVELSGGGRFEQLPVAAAREQIRRDSAIARGGQLPVGAVEELTIPGPAGPIPARLYRPVGSPRGAGGDAALVVYFHGGGHVVGDLDTHDQPCRFLAREVPALVLAVDYRLGPEHPFPAAVEDALAAFEFAHAQAAELGADPQRIAVAGDSAGGNLAAVVAVRAAAGEGPKPAFQALIYPVVDYSARRPSYDLFAEGFFLTKAQMDWYRDHYFAAEADRSDPDASPILAPDLSGVAPAHMVTSGFDPLRDEAEAYVERLRDAGVPASHRREADLVHGFINVVGLGGRALEAGLGVASALREGLAPHGAKSAARPPDEPKPTAATLEDAPG